MIRKKYDIFIVLFSLVVYIYVGISINKIITTSAPDFNILYKSTKDLLQNINPYIDKNLPDVFIYPVATGFFYIPFVLLPYKFAQGLFTLLSAFSVPLTVFFSLKLIGEKFSWRHLLLLTSLAFLAFPIKFTLGMGQSNLLATLLLVVGFYFYQKNQIVKAGIIISLSYILKPIIGMTVLFFVLIKSWRTLLTIIITIAFFAFVSLVIFDSYLNYQYVNVIVPPLLNGIVNPAYYNQGLNGLMSRLTNNSEHISYVTSVFNFLLIVCILYFTTKKKINSVILFSILITSIPLIHILSWQHHFAILIFPFIVATMKILKMKKYLLPLLLFVSYLLVGWNIKDPSVFSIFPLNLLLSHTFYGGLLLLIILFILPKYKKK